MFDVFECLFDGVGFGVFVVVVSDDFLVVFFLLFGIDREYDILVVELFGELG